MAFSVAVRSTSFLSSFRPLTNRNFAILWAGAFLSNVGFWIQSVAQGWQVLQLTNSAFLLGAVTFMATLPNIVLSPIGGVMADRLNRRHLLLITHAIFMLTSLLNGTLTTLHIIAVWHIMLLALVNGIVSSVSFPAWQTFVGDLVPHDQLKQGIALNSVQFNLSRVIGPALGGISIGLLGLAGSYYIRAASFVAILLSLYFISSTQRRTVKAQPESMLTQVNEGLTYLKRNRSLQLLMLMVFLIVFLVFPYATLLPIFAGNIFHIGARGLGLLDGSAGIGALCGSLIVVMLTQRMKNGAHVLIITCTLAGLACLLFGIMPSPLSAMPMLAALGATTVVAMASSNTTIQMMVPDAIRGRIISLWVLIGSGLGPFGNLVSGWVAQMIGAQTTLFINGTLCVLCTLVILAIRFRQTRITQAHLLVTK